MRNKDLLTNLTIEDFKRYAYREPSLEGNWLYRLCQAKLDKPLKNPYPKFDLDCMEERVFASFDDAIEFINSHKDDTVYCSWIIQMPVGGFMWEHGAKWLIDKNGQILDYTTCQSFGDGIEFNFFGRPEERRRFKPGDIVEVVTGEEVHLAVVHHNMPSIEECYRIYMRGQKMGLKGIGSDFTDESETVIDGPSYYCHDHVSPLSLMKPRFPIPPELEAYMKTWLETANNEHYDFKQTEYTKERQLEKGNYINDFYSIDVLLYYDYDNAIPLLHVNDYYGLKACLRIDKAEYHDHDDYTGRLTEVQIKALQSCLEMPEDGKSRWWYFLRDWNEDSDKPKIPIDTPLPDYTNLIKPT